MDVKEEPVSYTHLDVYKRQTLDLAAAVMRGEYGVDDERREKLGDRYQEVQDLSLIHI